MTADELDRFNKLAEGSYRKVFNMAFRLSGSRSDAEDLTQEAFFRAYRSFSDYQGDRPFENWIFRIVTRLFLDLRRSRKRRVSTVSYDTPITTGAYGEDSVHLDVPDHRPNPEEQIMHNMVSEDLQKVLATLSREQLTLVMLADVEQLPYADIAEIMEKPIGTIRSRLHRTHKLIRARLEHERNRSPMIQLRLVPRKSAT